MTDEQYDVLLQNSLEAAVQQHFALLFNVLMQSTDAGGIERFKKGLAHLEEKEKQVSAILDETATT